MNLEKISTYLGGILIVSILFIFAYQGIVEQHLYYDVPKINIRLDGSQASFFGLANLTAAMYLILIFLSQKHKNNQ